MTPPPDEHFRRLERMYASAPITDLYGARLEVRDGEAEVVVPVDERFFHAARALHGSVYFKVLDDAAFFAASSIERDVFVLTASFNLHLLRPVTGGTLRAVARVTHRTRRQILCDAEAWDDRGRPVARGSGAFMRSDIPLTEDVGYR